MNPEAILTTAEPRAAQRAIRLVFLASGTIFAAWAPLVPLVRERLGLAEATLGLILLALGAGGILTMPLAGGLVERHGSRAVSVTAGLGFVAMLPVLPLAPSGPLLALALFLFGAAGGLMDVSMNAQAVAVEARGRRPIMSSIHGLFSLGGLLGAGVATGLLALGLPPVQAALLIAAGGVVLLAAQFTALLPRAADRPGESHAFTLPRGPVVGLGLLAIVALMAEGSMIDWSGIFLTQERGQPLRLAGVGFAAFSLAMAAARLLGDRVNQRFGPVAVLAGGALLAAAGFLGATLLPWSWAALLGFVLIGLGLANAVPLLFSAAGRLPGSAPGTAIAAVATLGYAGLLGGPALIGFVAQAVGLPVALGGVGVLLLGVAALAGLVRR
ncbi:MFS transporter [Roseomonas sp. M0104]|uniref:MFS transporter n=1 Tax=Teichococcus coralli TaxID=2545983 RepID=A0A845BL23_9PROT|nr:MFS transporter [Pseudoroseomonas coralli]MXP65852.1 MFS transporter [Pseudoroseomonas coralli]